MRYFNTLLLVLMAFFSGCDYLDVVPDNDIETVETIFEKREQVENWFRTCHTWMIPHTASVITNPAFCGTDEVVAGDFSRYQAQYHPFGLFIGDGLQMAQDPYGNFWRNDAAYAAIRYCNTFLEKIGGVYNMSEEEKKLWAAEIKALKAQYYFELFRRYGPIILVPENIPANAGIETMKQPRQPVEVCVEAIVSLLDEAMKVLPPMYLKETSRWAYHSLESAAALKAMTLFYAASPLFNGNPAYADFTNRDGEKLFSAAYDPEKWKRAALAIDEALDLCLKNRKQLVSQGQKDIRSIMEDIENSAMAKNFESEEAVLMSQYYGRQDAMWTRWTRPYFKSDDADYWATIKGCIAASIKMVERYYTENGLPIDEDKKWDYAARYRMGKESDAKYKNVIALNEEVLNLHIRREPRFYSHIAADRCYFQRGTGMDDEDIVRAYRGERFGTLYPVISGSYPQNLTGYWIKKGSRSTVSNKGYEAAFRQEEACVLIRLADLYLMQAEAWNEYLDTPDAEHVYNPLNAIRRRAGIPDLEISWSQARHPDKIKTKVGMREIIHQEWDIEFAFEGRRFWNLRRWLTAGEELNDRLYGWNITGENARQFYNNFDGPVPVWNKRQFLSPRDYLFPIQSEEILISGCRQNPGW